MINLKKNRMNVRFPEICNEYELNISFQRTLRIPDDGNDHFLPPSLGKFPLRHIEDFDLGNKEHLKKRGGLIMPMFQSDALWLSFDGRSNRSIDLPIAIKVATGKINAVSGLNWEDGLDAEPQNYLVVPDQPWLDGFNVGKGTVRQFVAAPLGEGLTVEEQINANSDVGGIQLEFIPMKKEYFEKLKLEAQAESLHKFSEMPMMSCAKMGIEEMGIGAGGSMRQEIYEDEHGIDAWDLDNTERCFITLANAEQWLSITGEEPPMSPISSDEYTDAGLPWFDYFDEDKKAIEGAEAFDDIKSIKDIYKQKIKDLFGGGSSSQNQKVHDISPKKKGNISNGFW
jgi:hypothetical protein